MLKLGKRCLTFAQGFLLVNLLWLAAHYTIRTTVIPNPIDVYRHVSDLWTNQMPLHILVSLQRIAIGLALALALGVPVGILMAYSKTWNKVLYPLVYFTYPIPKTALLPIAMLLWGMHDGSKIAILFLILVFQVIVAVRDGVGNIDATVYQVVTSAGASRAQIIRHVTLPAILPELLTSLRVALGTAVAVLFFVEGYGTKYGMGYYILDAWSRIDYTGMYLGILVISVVGLALFVLVDALADRLCRWSRRLE